MLNLAPPLPACTGEEIFPLEGCIVGELELPQRQLEVAGLLVMRVEIDRDEQDVVEARGHLAVKQDLVVEGVVEGEIAEIVEGRILPADPVQLRDIAADIAGHIPVS